MKTTREKIEIMQAYERGEQIQIYNYTFNEWKDINSPEFNWAECDYQVKPKTLDEIIKSEFKDGDILFIKSFCNWILIYKENENKEYIYKYVAVSPDTSDFLIFTNDHAPVCRKKSISEIRFATNDEKQKLFDVIKTKGYNWNIETKTLEKLVVPKFKVGDLVQDKDGYKVRITEVNTNNNLYGYESLFVKGTSCISFEEENNWKLVSNKFDITILKPFDKVLMRSSNAREWDVTLFSHYSNNKFYGCGMCCDQCIPYKGNEHLLGTTNDCDDFYKNWE